MAAAESARSANRSPSSLWVPSEIFRWMTGARSARSAGLLAGSTPSHALPSWPRLRLEEPHPRRSPRASHGPPLRRSSPEGGHRYATMTPLNQARVRGPRHNLLRMDGPSAHPWTTFLALRSIRRRPAGVVWRAWFLRTSIEIGAAGGPSEPRWILDRHVVCTQNGRRACSDPCAGGRCLADRGCSQALCRRFAR